MLFSDICLNALPWVFQQDKWVQALFKAADYGNDEFLSGCENIENWENFDTMPESRLRWYETALGVEYHASDITKRRSIIKGYWLGWGHPSVKSVENIVELLTGYDAYVSYDVSTQTITIVSSAEDVPDELASAMHDLIRRHIPAHVAYTFRTTLPYLTAAEVNALAVNALNGHTVKAFNNNFYFPKG